MKKYIYLALSFLFFFSLTACDNLSGDTAEPEEECLPQTDPLLQTLTGGNSQTWVLADYDDDYVQGRRTIINDPLLITFRSDNTLTRSTYGVSGGGALLPDLAEVNFYIDGDTTGTYCIQRTENETKIVDNTKGYGENYDMIITFPHPDTLKLGLTPYNNVNNEYYYYTRQ